MNSAAKNQVSLQLVSKPKRSTQKDKLAEQAALIKTLQAQKNELVCQVDKLENPEQSAVMVSVTTAFQRKNRRAAIWGFAVGGWAPIASYYIAHTEIKGDYYQPLSLLVLGALLFSVITVFEWCKAAVNSAIKAAGFVVLLEGVMVFSKIEWLGVSALALLILTNGIQSACNLAIRKKSFEF